MCYNKSTKRVNKENGLQPTVLKTLKKIKNLLDRFLKVVYNVITIKEKRGAEMKDPPQ